MTVYIVIEALDYYARPVVHVASSPEKAEEWITMRYGERAKSVSGWGVDWEPWVIDDPDGDKV